MYNLHDSCIANNLTSGISVVFQAPPKQVPKTIENMRVYDETMVAPEDDEVRTTHH